MTTIFALSSGAPPAAIAIVRLSGTQAFEAVRLLVGRMPEPRRAMLAALHNPADGALLDRALVLTFPSPASATGEDLAEFHLHGGRAVVRAVEAALAAIPGLRRAEPGEFTRRALANGRIDLSEAEGLGDLLQAETEDQRRMALRAAEGGVRRQVEAWLDALLHLSAHAEALLDHSDEDDVAEDEAPLRKGAASLAERIETVLAQPPVERLRDGIRVVLAGPPNAGKSTLLNALAERDAAIVSPMAGTTRDRIEAPVVRDGIAWLLTDTAGLNALPGDAVEAIGIDRARAAMEQADLVLWLGDEAFGGPVPHLWVQARSDEPGRMQSSPGQIAVSAVTGEGMSALWKGMIRHARDMLPPADALAFNQRQRQCSAVAAEALRFAANEPDLLLLAEHLRSARHALDAITGRGDIEAVLDALFARFCIGK